MPEVNPILLDAFRDREFRVFETLGAAVYNKRALEWLTTNENAVAEPLGVPSALLTDGRETPKTGSRPKTP